LGTPWIQIDGGGVVEGDGLVVNTDGCLIRGLAITRFLRNGVVLNNPFDAPPLLGSGNTVGGTVTIQRNVISGNGNNGVHILNGNHNTVACNYIGTTETGLVEHKNAGHGILIQEGHFNTIGGNGGLIVTGAGPTNVISGNFGNGIHVVDSGDNQIRGNYIGLGADGVTDLGNHDGIRVEGNSVHNTIGGSGSNEGNIISGNNLHGITLFGLDVIDTEILGNRIGTSADGLTDQGNDGNGILSGAGPGTIIGGIGCFEGNVISGNAEEGVHISDGFGWAILLGNKIGTDITGTAKIANDGGGVSLGSNCNIVGGVAPGSENLISGNEVGGLFILGENNRIIGNKIGTNLTGTAALANGGDGVLVWGSHNWIGGIEEFEGNLISGNSGYGVKLAPWPSNLLKLNSLCPGGTVRIS
jgi:hypothetical protein